MPLLADDSEPHNLTWTYVQVCVVFGLALAWGIWLKVRRAASATLSPLNPAPRKTNPWRVSRLRSQRLRSILVPLLVQALVWSALTIAFAALLVISGPQPWANALHFAALNWMPWVVLAPIVFWYSGIFPLVRGRLWRSIPAHVLGCATCVAATLWVATYSVPPRGPRFEERRNAIQREMADRAAASGSAAAPGTTTPAGATPARPVPPPSFARSDRPDRPLGERREPFGRRGPWPWLGAALLRANFDAAVYLIVAIAAHAFAFYRQAQERERHAAQLTAGLARAKLDALRLQLQPHFLFNTLNAISTLVHRDAAAADELIGDLSELLRLSLQTSDHEVPLTRELELLDRYIGIEQARLGDRLKVVRDIDPAAAPAFVPTLLLQPLVENAIRHGIEPRLAPGTVTLRARRFGNLLQLSVADDGVGLDRSGAKSARRGIGIANTEARLRTLHGDAAQLSLTTADAGGVEVRITLPFSTRPRADVTAPADLADGSGRTAAPQPS